MTDPIYDRSIAVAAALSNAARVFFLYGVLAEARALSGGKSWVVFVESEEYGFHATFHHGARGAELARKEVIKLGVKRAEVRRLLVC